MQSPVRLPVNKNNTAAASTETMEFTLFLSKSNFKI